MDVTREYYPITGVEEIYIAENISDSESAYSAGTPAECAPGDKADWAEEQPKEAIYYKGRKIDEISGKKKETVVITVMGMDPAKLARIKGLYYDETTGRTYKTGDEEAPFCALGLNINKGKADHRCAWFPKGRFSGGNVVAEQQKDGVTLNMLELTFDVYTTIHEFLVNGEYKGVSVVEGDTSNDAFDDTAFFSQVQTPDTASAPSAVALSTIVPADGASAVALNASIVLTFNNKISSNAVMVINADTGAELAINKTWDAAGKVLTIAHASAFAASTMYVVAVAGVVDVYGQALAAVSKDFTTAAS